MRDMSEKDTIMWSLGTVWLALTLNGSQFDGMDAFELQLRTSTCKNS
jgi:hypothetical protein